MSSLPHAVVLRVLAASLRWCMIGRRPNREARVRLYPTVIQAFHRSPRSSHGPSRHRQFRSSTLGNSLASGGEQYEQDGHQQAEDHVGAGVAVGLADRDVLWAMVFIVNNSRPQGGTSNPSCVEIRNSTPKQTGSRPQCSTSGMQNGSVSSVMLTGSMKRHRVCRRPRFSRAQQCAGESASDPVHRRRRNRNPRRDSSAGCGRETQLKSDRTWRSRT